MKEALVIETPRVTLNQMYTYDTLLCAMKSDNTLSVTYYLNPIQMYRYFKKIYF